MRIITGKLKEHIAGEVTTVANCWRLTLKNGKILGFTDAQTDIYLENILYKASSGFNRSALNSSASMAVDNLEIEGILDSEEIKEQDIHAGLYDAAELEVFLVNYMDLSQGKILLKKGFLGEVTIKNGRFVVELRGLTQKLTASSCSLYSKACRAEFGDKYCKLKLEQYTKSGVISRVISNNILVDENRDEPNGYYNFAWLKFTSGNNNGIVMEVKEYLSTKIITMLPFPYPVREGDSYEITLTCDKSFITCASQFNNAINFRGEPHLPGLDKMLKTSATL